MSCPHRDLAINKLREVFFDIQEVELEIGGQRIDKLYSDWFRIYDELYRSSDEKLAYRKLADFDSTGAADDANVEKKMFVPLLFFFNRAPGLALPLVALQYHEVKVNILFENEANMALVGADETYTPSCVLYSTFVFLDTEERKRFSQQVRI
jgi:hypothetical protein